MGRRSINTTKSGKYMNPTDQARKEARKKELKKNKRQRQMVRAAVLKNKDPSQILEEMEKIDEMEYNVLQPSPLNEKVLRDKRKKLKETFDRVMRLLHNDEPEHWTELKRKEAEYEKRRLKKQQYYESVKHAQSVQVDEIPLPAPAPTSSSTVSSFTGSIRLPPPPVSLALPPFAPGAPPSVLKKADDDGPPKSGEKSTEDESKEKDLLGVPPGPPPNLFEMSDLDTDAEDDEVVLKPYSPPHKSPSRKTKQPNSLQKRMLAISGQNIDEFMREMENVHKKKHREKDTQSDVEDDDSEKSVKTSKSQSQSESDRGNDSDSDSNYKSGKRSSRDSEENTQKELPAATGTTVKNPTVAPTLIPLPPVPIAPPVNPVASAPVNIVPPHMSMPPVHGIAPPPPMLFRPPPMRPPGANMHNFGLHMPPVPPPGPRPHALGGLPSRMGIRMPPGPPPGLPPRMPHHMKPPHPHPNHQQQHQLLHSKELGKGITTITAKPQIRNLSADVTRFVPSTLRVKREEVRKPIRQKPYADRHERTIHTSASTDAKKSTTKDDAYLQFMNEMQGLL